MRLLISVGVLILICGCSPKVGSDRWCKSVKNKEKGDWTANEAVDYAKHCLLK